ncbi:hypothetical protein L4174_009780 [Photobacterium sp. CCB-ST2H9]|uniref:hypothetical protein n=1 Tax=Photobacterium sp. CCB-ST2H9 TaxID=2912855 RepID=UPI002006863E|nr:hypothetical protein [Photobacterium sp. CCB-ST2H9]UTM56138.1 hypothetical protein L4174_009780 [Photobacterium sp. CCB-ST2H9]
MNETLIGALNSIGTPIVIIASTAIAIIIGKVSKRLSVAAGFISVVSVALYVPIDLYPKARDAFEPLEIEVIPKSVLTYSSDMTGIELVIDARQGSKSVAEVRIPKPAEDLFSDKIVSLQRSTYGDSYDVKVGNINLGMLKDSEIESKGFVRPEVNVTPKSIVSSKRIYVGKSWVVNNTQAGKLTLNFVKTDKGGVVLKMHSSNFGESQPESITLENKSFDVMSFEGKYEATVYIQAADFSQAGNEWAAFTVIVQ